MRSESNLTGGWRSRCLHGVLALALILAVPSTARAQGDEPPHRLPETRHLAAALSDPESRDDTLLTMIAAVRLRGHARADRTAAAEILAERYRADRAWLDRLAARYERLPVRSPLLDPAAWFLLQELDQYRQVPPLPSSPLGPALDSLFGSLFDRSGERVAATLLPEVTSRMELEATSRWLDLAEAAQRDPRLMTALVELGEEWFEPWTAAEPPAPAASDGQESVIEQGAGFLRQITALTMQAGPPDALRLKRLRFSLHMALPGLEGPPARDAGYLLILAAAVNGLYAGEYLPLTESLLWLATGWLLEQQAIAQTAPAARAQPAAGEMPVVDQAVVDEAVVDEAVVDEAPADDSIPEDTAPPYVSPLPRALSELLPALSSAFSPEFSRVDPRIGSALATVFDVAQYIQSEQPERDRLRILLSETADVIARVVLLVPDMSYYFDQPVRQPVGAAIVDCIGLAATATESDPQAPLQAAIDACVRGLADNAENSIRSTELAGDADGPFGVEQLQRELQLAAWQRINYVLGYLNEEVASGCASPEGPLPNPLEWASLVTVLDWFARREPYGFRSPENRALLQRLREQGAGLVAALARQTDCISGSGSGVNDPVLRGLADYRATLNQLIAGLREAELAFRAERLEPGADVVLRGAATQQTGYRPEDLVIGPCDEQRVCEMRGTLEPSPGLLARFPSPYLLADQTRLGEVEICYDNVRWVERRAEPVRADDPHVANYFGRLSFDLVGRYREGGETREIFGFGFTSPDEYHYLFGASGEEVLDDACPTERVGTRIVTGLGDDRVVRVVPDRLTYLTAARTLPSRVIGANWSRGQQWRAALEVGVGVRRHEYPADPLLTERLQRHLQGLYEAEQAALYAALFTPPERTWRRRADSLYDRLVELSARKALVGTQVGLLYPQTMVDSDEIRGLLEGRGALVDERILRQFSREGVPVSEINAIGMARLERMIGEWNRLPDGVRRTGSVPISVAHALVRLAVLERDIFRRLLPGEYAPLSFDDLGG